MKKLVVSIAFAFSIPANAATKEVGPIVSNVVATLTDQAVIPFDASVAFAFQVTLTGNHRLGSPSSLVAGSLYSINVTQDATGSRLLTYGAGFRFPGMVPPVLSTSAGAVDQLVFYSDGAYLNFLSITKNQIAYIVPPSGVTASTNQTNQITVHWVDNSSDETSFSIQEDDGGCGFFTSPNDVGTAAANATSAVIVADSGGGSMDHCYTVVAYRGAYHSTDSNEARGTSNAP